MLDNPWILLSIYVGASLIVGFLVKTIFAPILIRFTKKTKWKSDDLIVKSITVWILPWFLALGLYLGLREVPMNERYHTWLENVIMVIYIMSVTWIIARVLAGLLQIRAANSDVVVATSSIISNAIKVVVYCIGLLVILQSLGIAITPILTGLGVGGLAVALALQDTLSNLFAGIQIIASGKVNPGDYIQLESGEEGYIQDITWRNTTIRAMANHIIVIPNAKLSQTILYNFNLPEKELNVFVVVGVAYDSDLDKVERVTLDVIRETQQAEEGCVDEFEPFIRFFNFNDSSIDLRAFLRVKEFANQFAVKSNFIKRLQQRYQREGINIPFPIRTVYMQK